MKPEEYLKVSDIVEIEFEGVGIVPAIAKVRPTLEKLKLISNKQLFPVNETVVFTDTVQYYPKRPVKVSVMKLFYSKKLVALRQIPEIEMGIFDRLDVEWCLTLFRKDWTVEEKILAAQIEPGPIRSNKP